jgi:hypothetical protein
MTISRVCLTATLLASSTLACIALNPAWDPPEHETVGDELGDGDGTEVGAGTDDSATEDSATGDGDGDGTGDGDGDGDGDDSNDDSGDGDDGGGAICDGAAVSAGPCPPGCDECYDGVCWRYCTQGACEKKIMLCPVSWSCRTVCIGKESCREASIICTGAGSCELNCDGYRACYKAEMTCADGPCKATCAAGNEACRQLQVKCGTKQTLLHCDDPEETPAPLLVGDGGSCECSTNCVG